MDTQVIICAQCGRPHEDTEKVRRDLGLRDDQQYVPGVRKGHYAVLQRRVFVLPNPAAGAEFIAKVPNAAAWRIDSFQAQFVTSAAIANRVPHFTITDGQGHSVYNVPASGNQVAGTTVQYSGAPDSVAANFDNAVVITLPEPVILQENWTFQSLTTVIDVGDQWSKVTLVVREYLYF
jgi:hypothetical protein